MLKCCEAPKHNEVADVQTKWRHRNSSRNVDSFDLPSSRRKINLVSKKGDGETCFSVSEAKYGSVPDGESDQRRNRQHERTSRCEKEGHGVEAMPLEILGLTRPGDSPCRLETSIQAPCGGCQRGFSVRLTLGQEPPIHAMRAGNSRASRCGPCPCCAPSTASVPTMESGAHPDFCLGVPILVRDQAFEGGGYCQSHHWLCRWQMSGILSLLRTSLQRARRSTCRARIGTR